MHRAGKRMPSRKLIAVLTTLIASHTAGAQSLDTGSSSVGSKPHTRDQYACALASNSGGATAYRVFEVDGRSSAPVVFLTFRHLVGEQTVRMAQCSLGSTQVERVLASLRGGPLEPIPRNPIGSALLPPSRPGVMECTDESHGAVWCYYTEVTTSPPPMLKTWTCLEKGEPIGRVVPLLPFGSLMSRLPANTVTPADVLEGALRRYPTLLLHRNVDGN